MEIFIHSALVLLFSTVALFTLISPKKPNSDNSTGNDNGDGGNTNPRLPILDLPPDASLDFLLTDRIPNKPLKRRPKKIF